MSNQVVSAQLNVTGTTTPGTASDTSALAGDRTILMSGAGAGEIMNIEVSQDGGTKWVTIAQLAAGDGAKCVYSPSLKMRTRRVVLGTGTPVVTVTANPISPTVVNLPTVTSTPWLGTGTDVSSIGPEKYFTMTDASIGEVVAIEASNDGGTTYQRVATIQFGDGPIAIKCEAALLFRTNRILQGATQPAIYVAGDPPDESSASPPIGTVIKDTLPPSGVLLFGVENSTGATKFLGMFGNGIDGSGAVAGTTPSNQQLNGGKGGNAGASAPAGNGAAVISSGGSGGTGSAGGAGGNGGDWTAAAGSGGLSANGAITAGNGGNANLSGGLGGGGIGGGVPGVGGNLELTGGNGGANGAAAGGLGGNVDIKGGNGGVSGGGLGANGGNVNIDAGIKNGTGVDGDVNVGVNHAININIGKSVSKIGFYGAAAVVIPVASANATVSAAGATPANTETTYTGGVGASAYSVGGLVIALKQLGLISQ